MNSLIYAFIDDEKLLARDELLEIADRERAGCGEPDAWEPRPSDNWMYFQREGQHLPAQGWKLHVSATPQSAPGVLDALLPVLFRGGASFKMVRSRRLLAHLNEGHSPRGAAGKFITIYPTDAEHAVLLAGECHRATAGLKGPHILSDRRYRPDSLVHYRYGAFTAQILYNSEGRIVQAIRDPQGRLVPDPREAWFSAPPWVEDPFRVPEPPAAPRAAGSAVLLGGRYEVTQALRHANKGGVYLGTDRETGATVVIKEARPQVGTDRFGRDAVFGLRAEAANLERLAGLGVAPGSHGVLEEGGHVFLVLDRVPGTSLRQMRRKQQGPLPDEPLLELARSIAALLAKCHGAGMVLRDFTPNNLMVLPGGGVLAIDLEMACVEGDPRPMAVGAFTPGYGSPQQRRGEPPLRADDEWSLAATLFFVATGRDPFLVDDTPPARPLRDRLAAQLREMVDAGFVPAPLEAPIVAGLGERADERWSAERVLAHLEAGATERSAAAAAPPALSPADTAAELVEFALRSVHPDRPGRPVDSSCAGQMFDPCSVQYGAAGVGMFLLAALPAGHAAGRAAVAGLARWTERSLRRPEGRPQGLYFGAAGAAWFLLEAAAELGDEGLRESACALARSLRPHPALWDVTHGASGVGMALLHFHAATGDSAYLRDAVGLAYEVMAAGEERAGGLVWPQPDAAGKESVLYGFAHGNAGIAYFLLAAHAASGEACFLEASEAAMATVVGAARVEDGCAYWPHGPDRPTLWSYWCNGASGVGTTLARLYRATGREHYRELAGMAAEMVYRDRWHAGLGQCHGLAGNAEFLLDMHQLVGGGHHLARAREMGRVLATYGIRRDGLTVFADDGGFNVVPDFAVGNSGIGVFFNRLATGAGRIFMVDGVIAGRAAAPEPVPA